MALPEGLKDFSVAGKAALIIGAEHPVGRVAAITLAEAGAKVMLASQEPGTDEALKETAKAVEAAGFKPAIQVQHAAIRADLAATADLAVSELGGLDILVTALDKPFYAPVEATDDSAFDRVMEDNFKTVWMTCQEVGRVMLSRGGSDRKYQHGDGGAGRAQRRALLCEEIAGALLYLVSPVAGFVTGESIAVDGGLLCRV